MVSIATDREGCCGIIAVRSVDAHIGAIGCGIDRDAPGSNESQHRDDKKEEKGDEEDGFNVSE
jgi:hypothetical protein